MRKFTGIAILALALLVLAQPAMATCASARIISTKNVIAGNYSYIYTPGVVADYYAGTSTVSPAADAWFWAMGNGDPALASGHDNGYFAATDPYYPYVPYSWLGKYPGYPSYVDTTWAAGPAPGIDGCIDLTTSNCTYILISDEVGDAGYYAFLSKASDAGNYLFDQPGGAAINLAKIPKPAITGTNRISTTQVDVTVQCGQGGGIYHDPDCLGDTLVGCRVLARNVARGTAPPTGRAIDQWTNVSVAPAGTGASETVSLTCSGDEDIYLVHSLIFDSGYETLFVSENSTRIQCGPNLAEPGRRLDTNLPVRRKARRGTGR